MQFKQKKNINELVILLSQAQKNSNIPTVKLETEANLKSKIEEIRNKTGKEPSIEELSKIYNDDYITKLCEIINKWKADISNLIKFEREVSQGDTMEEINFWRDYEITLKNVKIQIESPEVKITLGLVANAKKFFITKGFEEDSKLDEPIRKVEFNNLLLKELPISPLLVSTKIPDITMYLQKIFEHIKNKMKLSWYPVQRMMNLIEVISKDLNSHLISILGNKLMTMKFPDFINLYKECKELFSNGWDAEYEKLKKEIPLITKLRKEKSLIVYPKSFEHDNLKKSLKELKKI